MLVWTRGLCECLCVCLCIHTSIPIPVQTHQFGLHSNLFTHIHIYVWACMSKLVASVAAQSLIIFLNDLKLNRWSSAEMPLLNVTFQRQMPPLSLKN